MPLLTPPCQVTLPEVTGISPQSRLRSVLLPQPDGPTMLTISPSPRENEMLAMTSLTLPVSSPKILRRFATMRGGARGSAPFCDTDDCLNAVISPDSLASLRRLHVLGFFCGLLGKR